MNPGQRCRQVGRHEGDDEEPHRDRCYRPRYLNVQRLNYVWTIRHSSATIAGNLIT